VLSKILNYIDTKIVFIILDNYIVAPRFSTFMKYSSYTEYPWSKTGSYAKERFEIRFQFNVVANDNNESKSFENSLLVFLGQSTVGRCFLVSYVYRLFRRNLSCKKLH